MGKVFDLNGNDLTKTDATLRVPEAPADAAEVGKRNDAQTESLKAEKSRAERAEQKLQQQVDTLNAGGLNLKENFIRTQVDSYLTQHPEAMGTALAEETERAKAAEEANAKGIGQLKEDMQSIIPINLFDCRTIITDQSNNWEIVEVTKTSVKILHKNEYSTGSPTAPIKLPAGTYTVSYVSDELESVTIRANGVANYIKNGGTFVVESGNEYLLRSCTNNQKCGIMWL